MEEDGIKVEVWQAKTAVGKLGTAGVKQMIDQEEAKGTIESWDALWDFVQRFCFGKRTQNYIQSGGVGTAMEVGNV